MERKIFICDCHTVEHQFIVEYFNDGDDDLNGNVRLVFEKQ